jgi:hypothetical protein
MSLEDKGAQHHGEVVDKFIDPIITTVMSTRDYVVRPSATVAPIAVVLPPVAEAKGRFYSIVVREADVINTVTVIDRDDSECWQDITLNSKCDRLLMYSDGLFWHPLAAILSNFPEGYDYDYTGRDGEQPV